MTSAIEQTQLNATLLAIDEINSAGGVLGRQIEPVITDPASDPKQFRALAERLFLTDRESYPAGSMSCHPGDGKDFATSTHAPLNPERVMDVGTSAAVPAEGASSDAQLRVGE